VARDYEMEAAVAAVEGRVDEPIVRALVVGSPGSQDGSVKGALTSVFGRSRREAGLHARNVVVLTPTSVLVFSCRSRGWPPAADGRVAAWPVDTVTVEADADEKWSAFNASHSGSVTNRFYRITLTAAGTDAPIELEVARSDSARTTIQALEDATGSAPSKITARRRAKQRSAAASTDAPSAGEVDGE
jgi:hypothetical protein